ncbi:hypothetical protein Adt_05157 [Abeliophyllum distichum]|uniref:Uncharacterized protein n=1 Tax=Abeliophyllum distichum TaxID=126358 RepID=A0ABD1V3B0_9LAMI
MTLVFRLPTFSRNQVVSRHSVVVIESRLRPGDSPPLFSTPCLASIRKKEENTPQLPGFAKNQGVFSSFLLNHLVVSFRDSRNRDRGDSPPVARIRRKNLSDQEGG